MIKLIYSLISFFIIYLLLFLHPEKGNSEEVVYILVTDVYYSVSPKEWYHGAPPPFSLEFYAANTD